jgi:hypothetical protein
MAKSGVSNILRTVKVLGTFMGIDLFTMVGRRFVGVAILPECISFNNQYEAQKVVEAMAKQKAPSSRRANPEECGVHGSTPQ